MASDNCAMRSCNCGGVHWNCWCRKTEAESTPAARRVVDVHESQPVACRHAREKDGKCGQDVLHRKDHLQPRWSASLNTQGGWLAPACLIAQRSRVATPHLRAWATAVLRVHTRCDEDRRRHTHTHTLTTERRQGRTWPAMQRSNPRNILLIQSADVGSSRSGAVLHQHPAATSTGRRVTTSTSRQRATHAHRCPPQRLLRSLQVRRLQQQRRQRERGSLGVARGRRRWQRG